MGRLKRYGVQEMVSKGLNYTMLYVLTCSWAAGTGKTILA